MAPEILRIATRTSRLARAQSGLVAQALLRLRPDLRIEEVALTTRGDRDHDPDMAGLSRRAGVGFFVREVERALLEERADLAVHSLKDLPTIQREGLRLVSVPEREDPRDALAHDAGPPEPLEALPPGAVLATASPRRRAQILALRDDLEVAPVRGNVPTRLARTAREDGPAAVVLAMAGLLRLGLADRARPVGPDLLLPAPGQGALGLQCRADDAATAGIAVLLDHAASRQAVSAERAFLRRIEGGCALPAAAWAEVRGGKLRLRSLVADPDGRAVLRDERTGSPENAEELGSAAASTLLAAGAAELLGRVTT